MSKKTHLDIVNTIDLKLSGAKGIIDVCRAVTADGNGAAHHNGISDDSISWALYMAMELVDGVEKQFAEYCAMENKVAGPRAA